MRQENVSDFEEYLETVKRRIEQNGGLRAPETAPADKWGWFPERYRGATFENFEIGTDPRKLNTRNAIRDHVRSDNQLWIGGNGTGKTRLAYCCVKEYGARYRVLSHIFRQIKDDWEGEAYIIQELVDAPLLILDEAGRSNRSAWEQNILFEIIDGRYNAASARRMRPTVFITNGTDEGLAAYLGDALIDRLQAKVVRFDWESFREREACPIHRTRTAQKYPEFEA